eukprot:Tamp_08875.p4 GENE.Tamp_08875~~Tamp_08875.p4  ORF type:complete len:115 (+),score=20.90 Tamp_08875:382-726(+)
MVWDNTGNAQTTILWQKNTLSMDHRSSGAIVGNLEQVFFGHEAECSYHKEGSFKMVEGHHVASMEQVGGHHSDWMAFAQGGNSLEKGSTVGVLVDLAAYTWKGAIAAFFHAPLE